MKIYVEVKDKRGNIIKKEMERSRLSKYVVSERLYPVSYTFGSDNKRIDKPSMLKGKDLTENQIAELFLKDLI
jgi:hypothetical protein